MRLLHQGSVIIEQIGDIGAHRAPIEAAGFIFNDCIIVELANRSKTPTTNFEFKADDVQLALEVAQLHPTNEDWGTAVFWHTHPGGGIGPSRVDLQNKVGPITHLVVALTPDGYVPALY